MDPSPAPQTEPERERPASLAEVRAHLAGRAFGPKARVAILAAAAAPSLSFRKIAAGTGLSVGHVHRAVSSVPGLVHARRAAREHQSLAS